MEEFRFLIKATIAKLLLDSPKDFTAAFCTSIFPSNKALIIAFNATCFSTILARELIAYKRTFQSTDFILAIKTSTSSNSVSTLLCIFSAIILII